MALVKCKECGTKISNKAKICPSCGATPKNNSSIVIWIILGVVFYFVFSDNQTPEQRKVNTQKQAIAEKEKVLEEQENKRKGFHCLSSWDGSHRSVKKYVEDRMRDPDSFKHIKTIIAPVNEEGKHNLVMEYRAKNGFGGMNHGSAIATVDNATCNATIISIE